MLTSSVAPQTDTSVAALLASQAARTTGETAGIRRSSSSADASVTEAQAQAEADKGALSKAVDHLQTAANLLNTGLQFKIDDTTGTVQVVVIDKGTDKVIREIPSSAALKLAKAIKDTLGLIFDQLA
jgi:flagellar protein FlaG